MRSATVENSAGYLAARNDAIIAGRYETDLRVAELVALDVAMLGLDDGVLMLPASIQKRYPTDSDPRRRGRTRTPDRPSPPDISRGSMARQPRTSRPEKSPE
jgi:hypothetical protein